MIERLAFHIASRIHEAAPEETSSTEVLAYGLAYRLNDIFIIGTCLAAGVITDQLTGTILALVSFATLRSLTGGFHLPTLSACYLLTVILLSMIPHIHLEQNMVVILTIFSLVLIIQYGPTYPSIDNQKQPLSKIYMAVIIILLNLVILSPIMALTYTIQSLSLLIRR